MSAKQNITKAQIIVAIVAIILLTISFFVSRIVPQEPEMQTNNNENPINEQPIEPEINYQPDETKEEQVVTFTSAQDFKNYLEKSAILSENGLYGFGMGGGIRTLGSPSSMMAEGMMKTDQAVGFGKGGEDASRVSETNVQVAGIDEPDIVKTDGKEIYFSSYSFNINDISPTKEPNVGGVSLAPLMEKIAPDFYYRPTGGTKSIKAFPPAELKNESTIKKYGDLLLSSNTLIIFEDQGLSGYDVSNPASPSEKWNIKFKNNTWKTDARLYNDKIYLITQTNLNQNIPCPIVPMETRGNDVFIPCGSIYHPIAPTSVNSTYNVMKINPKDGNIEEKISFVGSAGQTVVYMSENSIYITYNFDSDMAEFAYNFFSQETKDIMPAETIARIKRLSEYELSSSAKMTELQIIYNQFQSSLGDDERVRIENEMSNRLDDYLQKNMRDFERTGITRISVKSLKVQATGNVPGRPLNQFSLDEYKGNLRIATTVNARFFFGASASSENDVYVLSNALEKIGSLTGLGLTERIYATRFVEDKGYLVTFRQTDPFYVLDLSVPTKPEMKGELKIPGFSSYLHPITKDLILGVGRENNDTKLSLFDVSSSRNPIEKAKYTLSESWSEVQNTHHAFLLDKENKVFFMPAGNNAFIFSYDNNELKLKRAVTNVNARRALYIDNYLYIIGDQKIVILDESDWKEVNALELQ